MEYKTAKTYEEVYNAFSSLKDNFFAFNGDVASFSKKIYENGICIICKEECICGIIAFYANNFELKTSYITSVMVAENARGRGVATELMNRAENYSRNNGMTKMQLEVNVKNVAAISLYEKLGYSTVEKKKDSSIMEKTLL